MSSMVKGEGRIQKFVLSQESKIGVAIRQMDMIRSTVSGASGRAGEGEVGHRGSEKYGMFGIEGRHTDEAYEKDYGASIKGLGGTLAQKAKQAFRRQAMEGTAMGKAGGMIGPTVAGMPYARGAILEGSAATQGVNKIGVAVRQMDMIRSTVSGASGRVGEGEVGHRGSEKYGMFGIEGRHTDEAYERDYGASIKGLGGTMAQKAKQAYRRQAMEGTAMGKAGVNAVTVGGSSAIDAAAAKAGGSGDKTLNLSFTLNSMNKKEIIDAVTSELSKHIDKMAGDNKTGQSF
jgi:hypothetical protein